MIDNVIQMTSLKIDMEVSDGINCLKIEISTSN